MVPAPLMQPAHVTAPSPHPQLLVFSPGWEVTTASVSLCPVSGSSSNCHPPPSLAWLDSAGVTTTGVAPTVDNGVCHHGIPDLLHDSCSDDRWIGGCWPVCGNISRSNCTAWNFPSRGEGERRGWRLKGVKCIGGNLFHAHAWREASWAA